MVGGADGARGRWLSVVVGEVINVNAIHSAIVKRQCDVFCVSVENTRNTICFHGERFPLVHT